MKKYQKIEDTGKALLNYYWLENGDYFFGLNPAISTSPFRLNFTQRKEGLDWVKINTKLFKTIN